MGSTKLCHSRPKPPPLNPQSIARAARAIPDVPAVVLGFPCGPGCARPGSSAVGPVKESGNLPVQRPKHPAFRFVRWIETAKLPAPGEIDRRGSLDAAAKPPGQSQRGTAGRRRTAPLAGSSSAVLPTPVAVTATVSGSELGRGQGALQRTDGQPRLCGGFRRTVHTFQPRPRQAQWPQGRSPCGATLRSAAQAASFPMSLPSQGRETPRRP